MRLKDRLKKISHVFKEALEGINVQSDNQTDEMMIEKDEEEKI